MSSSNVRNIDSLVDLHHGILKLSENWDKLAQEVQMVVHRCEEHFTQNQPAYWRHQLQLAERELTEAKDSLQQKRSAVRASDRPAATEAVKRVQLAERRMRTCQEKQRIVRTVSIEIKHQCDGMLGPLADLSDHCETVLPRAAIHLRSLIDQLKAYAEQAEKNAGD